MKAAYFEEHGGTEVIKLGELPDPVAKGEEIVIDIHAASVNGADWKVREGAYKEVPYFPYILGRDFSGTVCEVGGDITPLNRHKFRLSILERQVQYLTNERNKINDAIKSCEESIKIFTELKEKEEIR